MPFAPAMFTVLLLSAPASATARPMPVDRTADSYTDTIPAWESTPFISFGVAPMSTLHIEGFHPGIRYDIEAGLAWERGRTRIWVGPDFHISQYFGRKKPGYGLDAVMTMSFKHVYGRVGAGTVARVPARIDVHQTRPMMGGVIGGGLVGRLDDVEGRIGVDYDVRIDTTGRVAQTVLLTMRLSFGF